MSIKQGGKTLAGATKYHPDLFDFKWADHILNDAQWLMANPFSWQYGSMYQAAYANLSAAIAGKTLQSETVAGITVQFYLADDGHKICPASEESNVLAIYNKTGNAWYYIIDTTNQRFKLPLANKDSFGPLLNYAERSDFSSGSVAPDDGWVMWNNSGTANATVDGVTVYIGGNDSANEGPAVLPVKKGSVVIFTPDTGTPSFVPYIKNKATDQYKYLYFYIGAFTQTAIENTAGLNTELFNGKADLNLSNTASNIDFVVESQEPTATNGYIWYRKYKSGWCEQGGVLPMVSPYGLKTVVFPVAMSNTDFTVSFSIQQTSNTTANITYRQGSFWNLTTTSFDCYDDDVLAKHWQVSGIAA